MNFTIIDVTTKHISLTSCHVLTDSGTNEEVMFIYWDLERLLSMPRNSMESCYQS